jgi:hypothetical protein
MQGWNTKLDELLPLADGVLLLLLLWKTMWPAAQVSAKPQIQF